MAGLFGLFLALCTVFSVSFADVIDCDASSCDCSSAVYNASAPFPLLTVECSSGNMTIYVPKCQLPLNKYNASNLSLIQSNQSDCIGQQYLVNGTAQVVFRNPLVNGTCGNQLSLNSSHATFSNNLTIYPLSSPLMTKNVLSLGINCTIPLQYQATLNTTLNPKLGTTQIAIPGVTGTLTVTMALYTDETFTKVYSTENTELNVEDYAYIGISIPSLDANSFSVKLQRIYVSGLIDTTVYNLTIAPDSCPNAEYAEIIKIINNGNGTEARYKLKVFKLANEDSVKLMTDISVCLSACIPNCNGSRIIDRSSPENVATVQLEFTAASRLDDTSSSAIDRFSKTSAFVILFLSLIFVKFI